MPHDLASESDPPDFPFPPDFRLPPARKPHNHASLVAASSFDDELEEARHVHEQNPSSAAAFEELLIIEGDIEEAHTVGRLLDIEEYAEAARLLAEYPPYRVLTQLLRAFCEEGSA